MDENGVSCKIILYVQMETWLQIFSQSCVLSLMLSVIRQITTFSTRYQALMHRDTETWCTEEEISGRSWALQNITMWHLSYSCFKWFQGASHIPARDNLPGVITPLPQTFLFFFLEKNTFHKRCWMVICIGKYLLLWEKSFSLPIQRFFSFVSPLSLAWAGRKGINGTMKCSNATTAQWCLMCVLIEKIWLICPPPRSCRHKVKIEY